MMMLCLGAVYAWSIFSAELISKFGFTSTQAQIIFGVHIAIFPITMIFANMLREKSGDRAVASLSAIMLCIGYLVAGSSGGSFFMILIGVGFLAGIGTGLGYFIALTTPVKWFVHNKGFITGIAAAGFSLSSVILANIAEVLLSHKISVLQIFTGMAILYGLVLLVLAQFIQSPVLEQKESKGPGKEIFLSIRFVKLFFGMFCGTFAGLIIIGNLKPIGLGHGIDAIAILHGISLFALFNFAGRLIWGAISDQIGANKCLVMAFTLQAISIYSIGFYFLTPHTFRILSALIGFGFGAHFVLFVKASTKAFGNENLAFVYPFVFLGYASAGIVGPMLSGTLFDISGSYALVSAIAIALSLVGAAAFLVNKN